MKRSLIVFGLTFLIPFLAWSDPTVLGVIDDPQCDDMDGVSARLMFALVNDRWIALNDEYYAPDDLDPEALDWTIVSSRQVLGKVKLRETSPSVSQIDSRQKFYEIESSERIPVKKNEPGMFRGWCGEPVAAPLVLTSRSGPEEGETWKPFATDSTYREKLYLPVKIAIGRFKAMHCPKSGGPYFPLEYGPEDLVLYGSFRSTTGRELVSIGLNRELINCELPIMPEWTGNWFLLEGSSIEYLGNEMEWVDSGDYDGDGHSDLLFWHGGYNQDGYVLVYNRLGQKVEYFWDYN